MNKRWLKMEVIYSTGSRFAGVGIGNTAYHAARAINARGYLKRLITTSYESTEIDPKLIKTIPFGSIIGKMPFYTVGDNLFDFFASLYINKCDVFYGFNGLSLFSLRKAKRLGAKTFIDRGSLEATLQYKVLKEEYRRWGIKKRPISLFTLRKMIQEYKETDYISTPSKFVYESFLNNGYPEEKLFLNHLGVDPTKFKPIPKKTGKFRITYVGAISIRKGIPYLLRAYNELNLKGSELVLIGTISREMQRILRKYATTNIVIKGFVKEIVKVKELNNSSVFCFPSIEDGFGLAVLEAMACGIPVIVSENTGAKDLIEDGRNGFIIPIRDIISIKEKIRYFYDNPEEAKKMGREAGKTSKRNTWEQYGKNMIKKLEEIV